MGARLRPISSAWLAPAALAARLTAEAGQATGEGIASIGTGIARGVAQHTQNVQRKEDIARSESHYRDAMARQDKQDSISQLQAKLSIMEKFTNGTMNELELAQAAGDQNEVARLTEKLKMGGSTGGALQAELQRIMGIQSDAAATSPAAIRTGAPEDPKWASQNAEWDRLHPNAAPPPSAFDAAEARTTESPAGRALHAMDARVAAPTAPTATAPTAAPSARLAATMERANAEARMEEIKATLAKIGGITSPRAAANVAKLRAELGRLGATALVAKEKEDIATEADHQATAAATAAATAERSHPAPTEAERTSRLKTMQREGFADLKDVDARSMTPALVDDLWARFDAKRKKVDYPTEVGAGRDARKQAALDEKLDSIRVTYKTVTGQDAPPDADPVSLLKWESDREKNDERVAFRKETDARHAKLAADMMDRGETKEAHLAELRSRLAESDPKAELARLNTEHDNLIAALNPVGGVKIDAARRTAINARIAAIETASMELNKADGGGAAKGTVAPDVKEKIRAALGSIDPKSAEGQAIIKRILGGG